MSDNIQSFKIEREGGDVHIHIHNNFSPTNTNNATATGGQGGNALSASHGGNQAQVALSAPEPKPSFWQRLFGGGKKQEALPEPTQSTSSSNGEFSLSEALNEWYR